MKATIISCGTEIVTGQCVDTNSAWLSQRLTARGIDVVAHVSVGDDRAKIAAEIRDARNSCDLVVITGGLGPTLDDLIREAMADALGCPLELNREALRQVESFFREAQREMPASNKVQALILQGCEVIANPRGTAPGIAFWDQSFRGEGDGPRACRAIIALPGVPGEMKAMFEAYVEPRINPGGSRCTLTSRLLCYGISEARLGELIADMMARGRNPLVGTTASKAVLSIRILATAETVEAARAMINADRAELHHRVGSAVFGEDDQTLQAAVVGQLTRRSETVTTAESCTGGMLAQMITDVPGSSAVFLQGAVVYHNEAKSRMLQVPRETIERHGAISEEVARALAANMRASAGSTYSISTTGIAGPGGGSAEKPVGLVYIGLAAAQGVDVRRIMLGSHLTRDEIRDRACKTALNLLRLRLLE